MATIVVSNAELIAAHRQLGKRRWTARQRRKLAHDLRIIKKFAQELSEHSSVGPAIMPVQQPINNATGE